MNRQKDIFGWGLGTAYALGFWIVVMILLFLGDSRNARWVWGILGTLIWAVPLGVLLGKGMAGRIHALWILPVVYGATVMMMYAVFCGAIWQGSFAILNPHVQPGQELASAAILFGSAPALVAAVVFLIVPRERPEGSFCSKCGYDVRASIVQGRCPECGRRLVAGIDYVPGGND